MFLLQKEIQSKGNLLKEKGCEIDLPLFFKFKHINGVIVVFFIFFFSKK